MNTAEISIDISTLWRILKKYVAIIVAATAAASIVALILAGFVIEKKYSATAKLYVENRQAQNEGVISINDLNTAKNIVNTCVELFSTHDITRRLLEKSGLDYSVGTLQGMITMSSVLNSEFLQISLTMSDPQSAIETTNTFVELCIEEFNAVIDSGKIIVVDPAVPSNGAVFPNVKMFLAVGMLIGFAVSYFTVFLIEVLDTKVKSEDDLFKLYDIPVFAEILSFNVKVKGDYGYEYK